MICFDTEEAARKVSDKSTKLSSRRTYGRIFVNRDLPRDQRQISGRIENSLNQAARGSQHQHQRQQRDRSTALPNTNNNREIDDQNISTSDESRDDRDSSDSDILPD